MKPNNPGGFVKAILVALILSSGSIALADTLECKLVVNGQVSRGYGDRIAAGAELGGTVCTGKLDGRQLSVNVVDKGGFSHFAQSIGETIVIIDGGSSDKEVYARSFCSCSSM